MCLNLYEVLRADSGPMPMFSQCSEPIRHAETVAELAAVIQRYLRGGTVGDTQSSITPYSGTIHADTQSLAPYAARVDAAVSTAFQHAAEEVIHRAHDPTRRVAYDLLRRATHKGWTVGELLEKLTQRTCQPRGLTLPRLARERTMNRSWWTFNTHNMMQDSLFFVLDLLLNFGGGIDRLGTWLGVGVQQDPFDLVAIQELIVRHRHVPSSS